MKNRKILHKEIDLIQVCINRMVHNSFMLKGWMLSVTAGIWAFMFSKADINIICLISIVEITLFWSLEAYFLQIERRHKKLYSWVVEKRNKDSLEFVYDLDNTRFSDEAGNAAKIMFYRTLIQFYVVPIFMILLTLIISIFSQQGECYYVVWL